MPKLTPKQRLKNQADKIWKETVIQYSPICEVCNNEPTETAHHFFPKSLYGHLRYDINNGISIGRSCHFNHHSKGNPEIHQTIVEKRGIDWYKELKNKSRENPASYQTTKYYRDIIEQLKSS